jgi:hypothetical protein
MRLALAVGWGVLAAGSPAAAGEPDAPGPAELPACPQQRLEALPDACRQEIEALQRRVGELLLERDAAREELGELRRRIEAGRAYEPQPLEPLPPGERSSEGWGPLRWGMPPAAVRAELPAVAGDGDLRLEREVADRPAVVELAFQNERLAAVAVTFERRRFARIEDLVEEVGRLRGLLRTKYGPPTADETDLSGKGDDRAGWRRIAAEGRLALTTTWQTPGTEIVLSAEGRPQRATLRIRYSSRELERAAELRAIEDL